MQHVSPPKNREEASRTGTAHGAEVEDSQAEVEAPCRELLPPVIHGGRSGGRIPKTIEGRSQLKGLKADCNAQDS